MMIRIIELEEAGAGPLWVNPEHVRCLSAQGEDRVLIEFDNGDAKIVMGHPQRIVSLLERD
jgi:hypothetical protein